MHVSLAKLKDRSPTLDGNGRIMFDEDFSGGVGRWMTKPGQWSTAGCDLIPTSRRYVHGATAAKMQLLGSTGAIGDARHNEPYPPLGSKGRRIGLEVHFTCSSHQSQVRFWVSLLDGTYRTRAFLRLQPSGTGILDIDTASAWQEIATDVVLSAGDEIFQVLKIVGDYETRYYDRIMINNRIWDLRDYALDYTADTSVPCITVGMLVVRASGGVQDPYIGRLILTDEEP
jgi:hypothetical protein